MNKLDTVNLRGVRIIPENKDGIDYYIVVIDQPTSQGLSGSMTLQPVAEGATEFEYKYSGTLVEIPNGVPVTTYLVGVFTDQKFAKPADGVVLSVKVTAIDGQYAKGNPNHRRPPVNEVYQQSDDLHPWVHILKSETSGTDNYFVAIMANTNYLGAIGGFLNAMKVHPEADNETNLIAELEPLSGNKSVAAIGAIPSSNSQFTSVEVRGNAGEKSISSPPFDYAGATLV